MPEASKEGRIDVDKILREISEWKLVIKSVFFIETDRASAMRSAALK
jgi:hypothetical protein